MTLICIISGDPRDVLAPLADRIPAGAIILSARSGRAVRPTTEASPEALEEARPAPAQPGSHQGYALRDVVRTRAGSAARALAPGRVRRFVAAMRDEAATMRASGVKRDPRSLSEQAIGRILEEVDSQKRPVVVALDQGSQRTAWHIARARPDVLVLGNGSVALATVDALTESGRALTPASVREMLDPDRLPPTPTHHLPELRREGRPRVVSIVSNSIDGDSRVQKVAASLASLGYESILVGRHPGNAQDAFMHYGALVMRERVRATSRLLERDAPPRALTSIGAYPSYQAAQSARRHARARSREATSRQAETTNELLRRAVGVADDVRLLATAVRLIQFRKNRQRFFALRGDPSIETHGPWRRPSRRRSHWAMSDDLELGFGPILERLRPDAIHAHDSDTLAVAMHSADRLRAAGVDTKVVYDAHEFTEGIARGHARQRIVLSDFERRYVPRCDEVITVSEPIADLLSERYGLVRRPSVVTNAPDVRLARPVESLRERLDLAVSVPLMVYVGSVAPQRGADLAVEALAELDGIHLAVVARESAHTRKLEALAQQLGVSDRLHRHDYVAAEDVVEFLRGADVGLIPFRRLPNSALGLPTKFREYLLADLPIVASNEGLVANEITRTGVGELFDTNNSSSLARAVARVLSDPEKYRRHLSPELKDQYSWEHQEVELQRVYARIAPLGKGTVGAVRAIPRRQSVLIGRMNSAGQAAMWASSLQASGVPATSLQVVRDENRYNFGNEIGISERDWEKREVRLRAFVDLTPKFSHVIVESGVPIFGLDASTVPDEQSLTRSGVGLALLFHGSDIRSPMRHAARELWSPFRDPANRALTRSLQTKTERLQRMLASFRGPVFFSTPDLWDDIPWGHWVPVVVDTELFCPGERIAGGNRVPVVMHAPSHGALKGAPHVDAVLRRLHREGAIEYRRVDGVQHQAMPRLYQDADIVVDQILMNLIGVTAAEAMACGRVVVAHVDERLAERYPRQPPVVDATPDTLEQVVRELAADRQRVAWLGQQGREFALEIHDGRMAANALAEGLGIGRDRSG